MQNKLWFHARLRQYHPHTDSDIIIDENTEDLGKLLIHNPVAQAIDQEPPAILCWTRHSCLRRRLQTSISSSNRDSVISTTALYRQATTNHRPCPPRRSLVTLAGGVNNGMALTRRLDIGGCSVVKR
jgi:hypothetical protein